MRKLKKFFGDDSESRGRPPPPTPPGIRPRSLKELNQSLVPPITLVHPIAECINIALNTYSEAVASQKAGDLENAYISYVRFSIYIAHEIPNHPNYKRSEFKHVIRFLKEKCLEAINESSKLKKILQKRHKEFESLYKSQGRPIEAYPSLTSNILSSNGSDRNTASPVDRSMGSDASSYRHEFSLIRNQIDQILQSNETFGSDSTRRYSNILEDNSFSSPRNPRKDVGTQVSKETIVSSPRRPVLSRHHSNYLSPIAFSHLNSPPSDIENLSNGSFYTPSESPSRSRETLNRYPIHTERTSPSKPMIETKRGEYHQPFVRFRNAFSDRPPGSPSTSSRDIPIRHEPHRDDNHFVSSPVPQSFQTPPTSFKDPFDSAKKVNTVDRGSSPLPMIEKSRGTLMSILDRDKSSNPDEIILEAFTSPDNNAIENTESPNNQNTLLSHETDPILVHDETPEIPPTSSSVQPTSEEDHPEFLDDELGRRLHNVINTSPSHGDTQSQQIPPSVSSFLTPPPPYEEGHRGILSDMDITPRDLYAHETGPSDSPSIITRENHADNNQMPSSETDTRRNYPNEPRNADDIFYSSSTKLPTMEPQESNDNPLDTVFDNGRPGKSGQRNLFANEEAIRGSSLPDENPWNFNSTSNPPKETTTPLNEDNIALTTPNDEVKNSDPKEIIDNQTNGDYPFQQNHPNPTINNQKGKNKSKKEKKGKKGQDKQGTKPSPIPQGEANELQDKDNQNKPRDLAQIDTPTEIPPAFGSEKPDNQPNDDKIDENPNPSDPKDEEVITPIEAKSVVDKSVQPNQEMKKDKKGKNKKNKKDKKDTNKDNKNKNPLEKIDDNTKKTGPEISSPITDSNQDEQIVENPKEADSSPETLESKGQTEDLAGTTPRAIEVDNVKDAFIQEPQPTINLDESSPTENKQSSDAVNPRPEDLEVPIQPTEVTLEPTETQPIVEDVTPSTENVEINDKDILSNADSNQNNSPINVELEPMTSPDKQESNDSPKTQIIDESSPNSPSHNAQPHLNHNDQNDPQINSPEGDGQSDKAQFGNQTQPPKGKSAKNKIKKQNKNKNKNNRNTATIPSDVPRQQKNQTEFEREVEVSSHVDSVTETDQNIEKNIDLTSPPESADHIDHPKEVDLSAQPNNAPNKPSDDNPEDSASKNLATIPEEELENDVKTTKDPNLVDQYGQNNSESNRNIQNEKNLEEPEEIPTSGQRDLSQKPKKNEKKKKKQNKRNKNGPNNNNQTTELTEPDNDIFAEIDQEPTPGEFQKPEVVHEDHNSLGPRNRALESDSHNLVTSDNSKSNSNLAFNDVKSKIDEEESNSLDEKARKNEDNIKESNNQTESSPKDETELKDLLNEEITPTNPLIAEEIKDVDKGSNELEQAAENNGLGKNGEVKPVVNLTAANVNKTSDGQLEAEKDTPENFSNQITEGSQKEQSEVVLPENDTGKDGIQSENETPTDNHKARSKIKKAGKNKNKGKNVGKNAGKTTEPSIQDDAPGKNDQSSTPFKPADDANSPTFDESNFVKREDGDLTQNENPQSSANQVKTSTEPQTGDFDDLDERNRDPAVDNNQGRGVDNKKNKNKNKNKNKKKKGTGKIVESEPIEDEPKEAGQKGNADQVTLNSPTCQNLLLPLDNSHAKANEEKKTGENNQMNNHEFIKSDDVPSDLGQKSNSPEESNLELATRSISEPEAKPSPVETFETSSNLLIDLDHATQSSTPKTGELFVSPKEEVDFKDSKTLDGEALGNNDLKTNIPNPSQLEVTGETQGPQTNDHAHTAHEESSVPDGTALNTEDNKNYGNNDKIVTFGEPSYIEPLSLEQIDNEYQNDRLFQDSNNSEGSAEKQEFFDASDVFPSDSQPVSDGEDLLGDKQSEQVEEKSEQSSPEKEPITDNSTKSKKKKKKNKQNKKPQNLQSKPASNTQSDGEPDPQGESLADNKHPSTEPIESENIDSSNQNAKGLDGKVDDFDANQPSSLMKTPDSTDAQNRDPVDDKLARKEDSALDSDSYRGNDVQQLDEKLSEAIATQQPKDIENTDNPVASEPPSVGKETGQVFGTDNEQHKTRQSKENDENALQAQGQPQEKHREDDKTKKKAKNKSKKKNKQAKGQPQSSSRPDSEDEAKVNFDEISKADETAQFPENSKPVNTHLDIEPQPSNDINNHPEGPLLNDENPSFQPEGQEPLVSETLKGPLDSSSQPLDETTNRSIKGQPDKTEAHSGQLPEEADNSKSIENTDNLLEDVNPDPSLKLTNDVPDSQHEKEKDPFEPEKLEVDANVGKNNKKNAKKGGNKNTKKNQKNKPQPSEPNQKTEVDNIATTEDFPTLGEKVPQSKSAKKKEKGSKNANQKNQNPRSGGQKKHGNNGDLEFDSELPGQNEENMQNTADDLVSSNPRSVDPAPTPGEDALDGMKQNTDSEKIPNSEEHTNNQLEDLLAQKDDIDPTSQSQAAEPEETPQVDETLAEDVTNTQNAATDIDDMFQTATSNQAQSDSKDTSLQQPVNMNLQTIAGQTPSGTKEIFISPDFSARGRDSIVVTSPEASSVRFVDPSDVDDQNYSLIIKVAFNNVNPNENRIEPITLNLNNQFTITICDSHSFNK